MEGRQYQTYSKQQKFKTLPGAAADGTASTFQFANEDHTLGNSLRWMIMKNPLVEFCGYSIPHPSESLMNLRIQTYQVNSPLYVPVEGRPKDEPYTALEALEQGLDNLIELCDLMEEKFKEELRTSGRLDEEDETEDVAMEG